LKGIDFDWEFDHRDPATMGMTTDYATHLFTKTRESLDNLGGKMIMTITPDGEDPKKDPQSLNIERVNDLFDAVIVQSYGRVGYIDNYLNAGFDKSILFCGICSERDDQWWPNGQITNITEYTDKVKNCGLPGLYSWRIDNDDTENGVPRYTITSQMWEYSRGEKPQPPLYP